MEYPLSLKSEFLAAALALMPFTAGLAEELSDAVQAPGQIFRDCPTCPEMVVLPAGEFDMGKGNEEAARSEETVPLHRETILHPFAIGRYEVTLAEFATFVHESGPRPKYLNFECNVEGIGTDYREPNWWKMPGFELYDPTFWQQPNHPVVCVSHDDAAAYATWLSEKTGQSYRLPTEAEWEYAYRAGTSSAYYWGDEPSHAQANYGQTKFVSGALSTSGFTAPVGRFPPNGFGVHDMAGNAAEWVDECYMEGSGIPCIQWVARGGSWYFGDKSVQAQRRTLPFGGDGHYPASSFNDVGFRLVRDLFPVERAGEEQVEEAEAEADNNAASASPGEQEEPAPRRSELRLNRAYESLMLRSSADAQRGLEATQRAWSGFRDAQCAYQTRFSVAACAAESNLARAALLEDALRLGPQKGDDPRLMDDKRGTLGHLSQFIGTYRYDALLDEPAVAKALEELTGKEVAQLIRSDMEVIFPIQLSGFDLVLRGRRNHQGMEEEALVYVDIYKGTIRVGLIHEGKPTLYAREKEYESIPDELRDFVRWPTLTDERLKYPPAEAAPPKGVKWVR